MLACMILQEPPPTVLPPGSVALKEAAETQLKNESSAKFSYKVSMLIFFISSCAP
jgi:hypothetical protein